MVFGRVVVLVLFVVAPAVAQEGVVPDDGLSPGFVQETDVAVVCQPGYSRWMRSGMSRGLRASVYRAYGVPRGDRSYVIDHRVPLSLGGANDVRNLWPEREWGVWGSHVKDGLEDLLHLRVCRLHTLGLAEAQAVFLGDWRVAWVAYGRPSAVYLAE